MSEKIHVFEKAGLGVAPFRFVSFDVKRGPIITEVNGITVQTGAEGQPMGTCAYCGNGIANCFEIESSDGNHFIVGSECVAKTGDRGLKVEVDKIKTAARHAREEKTIADNLVWVEAHKEELQKIQHGKYDLLNSIEWHYKNAGNAGKIRIVNFARRVLANS